MDRPERINEPTERPIGMITEAPAELRKRPLVFISHDHRDADLAEAFANLLTDASGGIIKSFRSSDRRGTSGIEFGSEWYTTVMSRLDDATDVVALLTPSSMDRPWILYEAGVAKGKLGNTVFGVAIQLPLDRASRGPFAQFQNSDDSEDSLTQLVLQLIRRNVDAEPREEAVRRQVDAFRTTVTRLRGNSEAGQPLVGELDSGSVAKLFEEVKLMVKELSDRLQKQIRESVAGHLPRDRAGRSLGHLLSYVDFSAQQSPNSFDTAWLMMLAQIRDDVPWIYEAGMKVSRALNSGNKSRSYKASTEFSRAVMTTDPALLREFASGESTGDEMYYTIRQLVDILRYHIRKRFEHSGPEAESASVSVIDPSAT